MEVLVKFQDKEAEFGSKGILCILFMQVLGLMVQYGVSNLWIRSIEVLRVIWRIILGYDDPSFQSLFFCVVLNRKELEGALYIVGKAIELFYVYDTLKG